jgi:hypothetical protein
VVSFAEVSWDACAAKAYEKRDIGGNYVCLRQSISLGDNKYIAQKTLIKR